MMYVLKFVSQGKTPLPLACFVMLVGNKMLSKVESKCLPVFALEERSHLVGTVPRPPLCLPLPQSCNSFALPVSGNKLLSASSSFGISPGRPGSQKTFEYLWYET